ncbi:hypothetical protein MHU86_10374 [Fragilaria crotonensis]|nr:hypothetical protein MHU86_10374 [Fragilaria crotonensis]
MRACGQGQHRTQGGVPGTAVANPFIADEILLTYERQGGKIGRVQDAASSNQELEVFQAEEVISGGWKAEVFTWPQQEVEVNDETYGGCNRSASTEARWTMRVIRANGEGLDA